MFSLKRFFSNLLGTDMTETSTVPSSTTELILPQCVAVLSISGIKEPTEDEIRDLAHSKWEKAGCPAGDGVEFWLEAERELKQ